MCKLWGYIFRISGCALALSAVAFMTVPYTSKLKKITGALSAFFGLMCILSMYFAKKTGHIEEIHAVNQELSHYEVDDDDRY
jgi:hypothetical protein